jgi:NRAMP (natural resistance-associated macrophage protein)-like metal ion transporter
VARALPRTFADGNGDGAFQQVQLRVAPLDRVRRGLRALGPGLITGAADDDPSGIATYSQAGAAFGFGLLWTALLTLPLMSAVQLLCARIGLTTRQGLASVLRSHYPPWLLWVACVLLLIANTVNIAADLGGMAAAAALVTGMPPVGLVPAFAFLILGLLTFTSYTSMNLILKWMTVGLFAYVVAAFLARPDWGAVIGGTFWPRATFGNDNDYLLTVVAILGTTISPYLFFWQAAQEAEDEKHHPRVPVSRLLRTAAADTNFGMLLSNVIMYFIIVTTGATLHPTGVTRITTAAQAAAALRPLAGGLASLLFALGIVGTGLLAVPVLAGSAAYAITEAARWRRGMDEKVWTAPQFYAVIAASTVIGVALNYARLDAMRLLFWSAVINGLLAPPLIVIILVVSNNSRIMGSARNGIVLNVLGGAAALVMTGGTGVVMGGLTADSPPWGRPAPSHLRGVSTHDVPRRTQLCSPDAPQ